MSSFHLSNELISILKSRLIIFELETERRNGAQCRHCRHCWNKESSVWLVACWCHQLNTLADKCRLNWWLNCTKKFSMNPIEILEILAIAVHSFREMLGLGQTPDSSDVGSQCSPVQSAARQPAAYSDQSNIDKTEEKSEKITRAALQVIVSWPAPGLCWQIGPVFMLYWAGREMAGITYIITYWDRYQPNTLALRRV